MAKKTRAARKATMTPRRDKLSVNTREATVAIEDLLKRIRETKVKETNWTKLESAQVELAEFWLSRTLKKMACPPTQSLPRFKKRIWHDE